jgi:hypothetical protein
VRRSIEHVTGGKGRETRETERGGIVSDLTASFVQEETIVDDLTTISFRKRREERDGGPTMTATDSQIPAARHAKMWNTSNCS